VFAAIAGQATAAGSRVSSLIVFSAALDNGTDGQQLFRVRVDGSGLEQISFGRKIAQDPVFSPNGKRVVFARLGEGLFVINVHGSGLRRLTPDGTDHAPAWSRDGQRITFLRSYKNAYRVYVMRADGKRQRRLFYALARQASHLGLRPEESSFQPWRARIRRNSSRSARAMAT
jgi:Tol biopolymer transport system component